METHYEVELYYIDGTSEAICKINYIEDDIIIEYDDKAEKEDTLYINPIDSEERTTSLDNINEIYIIEVDDYGYIEDRFLFWRKKSL